MELIETKVYVHSPITEYSVGGGYYTSYAILLMSNNPCFSYPHSHVRRRYSDFVRLRELLLSHQPTLTPPALPSRSYLKRFNDDFIEQRMKGLQKFLQEVLATPLYLSDKSLHLFLQSNSSMSKINEECHGDIPAPPLIDPHVFLSQSERSVRRDLHHVVLDDSAKGMQSQRTVRPPAIRMTSDVTIPSLNRSVNKPILIPKRNGSLDSSTASSPSSSLSNSDNSYSSTPLKSMNRRVSFNDRVKIAVVTHYGISVLRP